MKHYILKLVILMTALQQLSCKKFIDIDPPRTSLVNESVFKTNDQATAAVLGVYATMRTSGYASGNIQGITAIAGFSSDELICYNPPYLPFFENQLSPELATGLPLLYSGPYNSILTANLILEGLSAPNGITPQIKSQLVGEALFIRAFAYFYLVNMFGGVPLHLTSDYRITLVAPKATPSQIYAQIISDLITSEVLLPESSIRIRPSKSAAQAMLARTYLYLQDWANAEKYASLIIGKTSVYNLVDFNSVFLSNSQEAIWQLQPAPNTNAIEAAFFIPANLTIAPSVTSLPSSFVLGSFEPGDKRKDSWVRSFTISSGTYYYPFKYKIRSATTNTEESVVLRLAEQYLIRAEARIHLGRIDLGMGDLNIIRRRPLSNGTNANSIPALSTNLTQIEALSAVEHERQVELFLEWGHRWFDLKRTGKANLVLGALKPLWKSTDALYPIPQDEINRNRNILQNDGY